MDNTELNVQSIKENLKLQMQEAEINLKTFKAFEQLKNNINILEQSLIDLKDKENLDGIKEAIQSALIHQYIILNDYESGLLELEEQAKSRPD